MTTSSPKTRSEISLIYYANRDGLEDRVFRIKTERSSASMPEPRTSHMIANVEILEETDDAVEVRYNFQTLSHRYKITDQFFGTTLVTLAQDRRRLPDRPQEDRPEERLHPPGHRRLPRLTGAGDDMSSYRIALNFEDGVTRIIECGAKESPGRGVPPTHQPAHGLLRRRVRHLQVPRRERAVRPGRRLHRGCAQRARGRQGLVLTCQMRRNRLRGRRAGGLHRLQDRHRQVQRQGGRGHRLR
jgi:hypothetical protein